MTDTDKRELEAGHLQHMLRSFTGTEGYYRHPLPGGLMYTDGVKYFVDAVGGYWFLDIIATEFMRFGDPFAVINFVVADDAGLITATDGDSDAPLHTRDIAFTDCLPGAWQFYLIDKILLLPSEY